MAVNVEMWKREIIERLQLDNRFMAFATDADDMVYGGSVVHIPQSAGPTPTIVNNSTYPLTVVQRGDTDITYALDRFSKQPVLITDIDKAELSYDKMQSVIDEQLGSLLDDVGTWMLYRWALSIPNTTAFRVATSSATTRPAGAAGATGTRKRATEADIIAMKAAFDAANVPMKDRYFVLCASHYNDLLSDTNLKNYFQNIVNIKDGDIPALHGFKFIQRNLTIRVASGGTVKAPDAANATDDNEASVAFAKGSVEKATGTVDIFENLNRAEYQGDIVSFLIRNGGRRRRNDNAGVGLLVDG
ncbi:MAG: hypothetical protein JNM22_01890 [Saprospiraceae bacterium]|nr:hypothetical protein [Saprospiraceae bacterium]